MKPPVDKDEGFEVDMDIDFVPPLQTEREKGESEESPVSGQRGQTNHASCHGSQKQLGSCWTRLPKFYVNGTERMCPDEVRVLNWPSVSCSKLNSARIAHMNASRTGHQCAWLEPRLVYCIQQCIDHPIGL